MAQNMAQNPSPELWTDKKREEFLTVKYHYLTRHIHPPDFYSYFRTKNVFSLADQEEVENKFHSTWLKAGHLIDIISRKGQTGFIAFMEVIEYTDKELFESLTERKARDPPPSFIAQMTPRMRSRVNPIPSSMRRKNTESMEVLGKLCDLTTSLCSAMTQKKVLEKDIRQLSDFTEQLKNELDDESKEKQRLIENLDRAKVDNDQLLSEKLELENKVESLKSEIRRLEKKNEDINKSMELLKKNLEESRKNCDRKVQSLEGEIRRSKTMHPAQIRTRTLPPDTGRGPQDMYEANGLPTSTPPKPVTNVGPETSKKPTPPAKNLDLNKLKEELSQRDVLIEQLKKEKENLIKNLSERETELSSVQESCDNQDKIIKELREENNKICKSNEELEERVKEVSKSKEQKEEDCKELEKRYRDVAELNRTLYEELDVTHKQRGNGFRKQAVMPNGNCEGGLFKGAVGTVVPCPPPPPASELKIERSRSDDSTTIREGIIRKQPALGPPKKEDANKRHGSASLKAKPLVIYMNKTMEVKMVDHLRKGNRFRDYTYGPVQSEEECKRLLENFDIVHYEKCKGSGRGSPTGSDNGGAVGNVQNGAHHNNSAGYQCIYTDNLSTELEKFKEPPILLKPLPVDALRRMSRVSLLPIIVFLKHSPPNTNSKHSQLQKEEEAIQKASLPYETVTVTDEELKADIDAACDKVVDELRKLVTDSPDQQL